MKIDMGKAVAAGCDRTREEQPMSYTYRTDKLLDAIGKEKGSVNQRNCPRQWVGFAIELETELQEATFEIERLKKSNLQLREGAEESKKLIQELNQRVKYYIDQMSMLSESKARLSRYCDTAVQYIKKNERLTKKVKQLYKRTEKQNQRIKQLEDIIKRASSAFFCEGSDKETSVAMLTILEESR